MDVHRPVGLAVLMGPGVRDDERLDRAALPDILPTALALLGLPTVAGLPGRVWREALKNDPPAPPSCEVVTADIPKTPRDSRPRVDLLAHSASLLAARQRLGWQTAGQVAGEAVPNLPRGGL